MIITKTKTVAVIVFTLSVLGLGVWAYWAFNDYPDTVKFLTESERSEIYRRLDEDRGSLADEYDIKYVWQAFKDWKVYAHCFNFLG